MSKKYPKWGKANKENASFCTNCYSFNSEFNKNKNS